MIFWILFIALFVIVVIGWCGIQRTGNYENSWGYMFWYGLFAAIALSLVAGCLLLYRLVTMS